MTDNYTAAERLMFSYMRSNIMSSIENIMLNKHSRFTHKLETITVYGSEDGEWIHSAYVDLNNKQHEFVTVNIGFDDDHKIFCEFNKYGELYASEVKLIQDGYSIDNWEEFVIECLNTTNHFAQL